MQKNTKKHHVLDHELRPDSWETYIGQETIKKNLRILLEASQKRNQVPEHILFHGPPGLGKTTLAHLIAKESGAQIKITSGPAIEKVGDLASVLTNLSPGDILFIDEIHRLHTSVEEVLYPAMESGVLDIIIGKGPSARTIQLELPPFTLIAATTRVALISSPLRSRFSGGSYRLELYTPEELGFIIKRSASILGVELGADAVSEIAQRARSTPRIANYFLKRVRDYGEVKNTPITQPIVHEALTLLGIDTSGLNKIDQLYLRTLVTMFDGGPVGLKTLSAALHEEETTLEYVIEPFLIQSGFIEKTPKGRMVTALGKNHVLGM